MAVVLKLKRLSNTPWGFRLTGGADVDVPLTVIKVKEGSLAEEAGLLVKDVILKINGIPTTGLVHEEIHDVIVEAGNELDLEIQRDEDDSNLTPQEEIAIEVDNEVALQNLRNLELQRGSPNLDSSEEVPDKVIAEVISGQAELLPDHDVIGVNFNNVDLSNSKVLETVQNEHISKPEKKWSTFLQKPKGPTPRPKFKSEPPKYPPYNPFKLPKKEIVVEEPITVECTEGGVDEEIISKTNEIENAGYDHLKVTTLSPIPSENTEIIDETDLEFQKDSSEQIQEEREDEYDEERVLHKPTSDESSRSEAIKAPEVTPSLEEQLAQVQKQLQALSHLPSSIQSTIEAVTQQLAKIASQANQASSYKEESSLAEQQDINYDELAERLESAEEGELDYEYSDKESDVDECEEDRVSNEIVEGEGYADSETSSPILISEEHDSPQSRELTEEEVIEIQREQERIAKQQKETGQLTEALQRRIEQRPTRALAPLQRPIFLPGGRKWTQPDDAAMASKPRKMTDEKIAETIETYSEVITGKLKGINFLKYTPPPKNLDYLQKSEVFRLLHEMDPPPRRGIASRPEIIPAVQDIYEKRTLSRGDLAPAGVQR